MMIDLGHVDVGEGEFGEHLCGVLGAQLARSDAVEQRCECGRSSMRLASLGGRVRRSTLGG